MNSDIIKPDWLPDIISIDGIWDDVVAKLYKIFESDIKCSKLKINNMLVWHDKQVIDRYEEGFWHLISGDDYISGERIFDPRRSERLPWFKPLVINFLDKNVLYWEYLDSKKKTIIYIWLVNWDYVIIFQKRSLKIGDVAFIKTAYYVDGNSTRRNLRKKYSKRIV